VRLYFVSEARDQSQIAPLELDLYGNILNWPEEFFGDEMGEVVAMQSAALRRRMKEERR